MEKSFEKISSDHYVETCTWQEFYENGKLQIDGEIAIVSEESKHLFKCFTGYKGYEGKPVCKIGIWKTYFINGALAWESNHGDGSKEYYSIKKR
jgi:antitoxin component YwqK of YwqJK toxin-antitoxin module